VNGEGHDAQAGDDEPFHGCDEDGQGGAAAQWRFSGLGHIDSRGWARYGGEESTMKALSTFLFGLVLWLISAADVAAQGTFTFNNNAATRITNCVPGQSSSNITVAMYYNLNTNAVSDPQLPMLLNTNAITNTFANGGFFGGERPVPDAPPGSYIAMEMRAWGPGAQTWEEGQKMWNCHQSGIGQSRRFIIGPLGGFSETGEGVPPPAIFGANKLNSGWFFCNIGITICEPPRVSVVPGSYPIRLRIDSHPHDRSGAYQYRIYVKNNLFSSSSWLYLTNVFRADTNFPIFWTDPAGTNGQRFYRAVIHVF
jgi:hypothetical protein